MLATVLVGTGCSSVPRTSVVAFASGAGDVRVQSRDAFATIAAYDAAIRRHTAAEAGASIAELEATYNLA